MSPRPMLDSRPVLERYDINENGCWVWAGSIHPTGYGRTSPLGYIHRFFYEVHVGPIPEGMVVDHLCMNKPCVNPAHLEAVTQHENVLRAVAAGLGRNSVNVGRTHCDAGHELTPENAVQGRPFQCKLCMRERTRARRQAQRESRDALVPASP